MPLTSSASDAFGAATLVLVLLLSAVGAICLAFVLRFHSKVGKEWLFALRDFDSPWIVRIVLTTFAIAWGLNETLRLPILRKEGWPLHHLSFAGQANLCRLQAVLSLGLTEPGFLLTALFLVNGSLNYDTRHSPGSLNRRILRFLAAAGLPVFVLQIILMTANSSSQFLHGSYDARQEGYGGVLPSYSTMAFREFVDESGQRLTVCAYPLLNVLLFGLFGLALVTSFLLLGRKVLRDAINRKLRARAFGLVTAVALLIPLQVLFLGISARAHPGGPAHGMLSFLGFLAVFLWTLAGEALMVIFPVSDALAVGWVVERRHRNWSSLCTSPMDAFRRSTSFAVSDDEESVRFAGHNSSSLIAITGTASSTTSTIVEPDISATVLEPSPSFALLGPTTQAFIPSLPEKSVWNNT